MFPSNLVDRMIPTANGDPSLSVADGLKKDPQFIHYHRPFLPESGPNADIPCVIINMKGKDGKPWTVNEKGEKVAIRRQVRAIDALMAGHPIPMWVFNATSTRRDDWIQIQDQAEVAYRNRLKLIGILQSRVSVPGSYDKLTYEYDAMSDAHSAVTDMDFLTDAHGDAPLFLPRSVPQPATHCDFSYGDRFLAVSRSNGRSGNDVLSSEMAARRVAELVEDTAFGIVTGLTYGTRTGYFAHDLASTWFGLLNYTNRNIKNNMTAPTAGGWVPDTTYNEILSAIQTLLSDKVYGPFAVFYSTDWDQYMQRVYSLSGGNTPGETLRSMLLKHPDIEAVERADRLTNTFTIVIQALDRRYIVFIDSMGLRTWQWPTKGGLQQNFKVGVIQSTLPKSDYSGNCGTMILTTS